MIYLKIFEDFKSDVISIVIDGKELTFTIKSSNKNIYLMKNNNIYQKLDINIPDSSDLDDGEFFMNPNVKNVIVDELKNQGFIQELNKESIAGDKKVKAYKL